MLDVRYVDAEELGDEPYTGGAVDPLAAGRHGNLLETLGYVVAVLVAVEVLVLDVDAGDDPAVCAALAWVRAELAALLRSPC